MPEEPITRQVNFRQTAEPLIGYLLSERCPIGGKIKSITMSFPPGCSNMVDVACGHGEVKVCPYNDYIALDEASPTYTGMNEPVKMDERLWCEIKNGDDTFAHTIEVLMVIVGEYGDMAEVQ